jgi:hypothetical protein
MAFSPKSTNSQSRASISSWRAVGVAGDRPGERVLGREGLEEVGEFAGRGDPVDLLWLIDRDRDLGGRILADLLAGDRPAVERADRVDNAGDP